MLVIDDFYVKKLEEFGFKPKYSEETGELEEYFYAKFIPETYTRTWLGFKKIEDKTKKKGLRVMFMRKRDENGWPIRNESKVWGIRSYAGLSAELDLDKLYELIQAGVVRKI